MEEINKKKIIKSRSYNDNFPAIGKNFIHLKPETDENKLNMSILKKSNRGDKKVLFNINKFKIKNEHNKNNYISSNINDSLLRTNITKNQTDLMETLKKSTENKNVISNNDATNYIISTENKTLNKNKTQGNLYNYKRSLKYNNNPPESKDSLDDNIFNLNLFNDINNDMNSKVPENFMSNLDNDNIPFNNVPFNETNKEHIEHLENTIHTNTQYPFLNKTSKVEGTTTKLNTTKRKKAKMWDFLMQSKKEKTTANEIIRHYLRENERDTSKNIPFSNFKKYLQGNDYRKFNYSLNKIYGNSKTFLKRVEEIKKNNVIALKKDFNIEDYQKALLQILKKRISERSYIKLQTNYKLFNERNYDQLVPKGRFITLAEKLKDFLSRDIYEKMKRNDRNYRLYLKKQKEEKLRKEDENENRNTFYQKINKTLRATNKKMRRNQSY